MCLCLTLSVAGRTWAQDDMSEEDLENQYEKPLTIDLDALDQEEIKIKKKKPKRNVFYGKKTRKGFTSKGYGDEAVVELFYVLKTYEDPLPYVRDVYWFDPQKRKIIKSRRIKAYGAILHGPYKKMVGEQVVEEGIFYLGVKHGRWTAWDKHNTLKTKEKYYKGWPKESLVAYYNKEKKQLKEVIPVRFGEKEGYYYAFYKSGRLAARGEYHFDQKVGVWREYYDLKNRRKREIVYPKDPFDTTTRPYIAKEWNSKGKLIYSQKP